MKKLFGGSWAADILVEIVGSFLTAIGLYNFAVPAAFPMTGFSGLALILYRLFSLPIGVMTIVLNMDFDRSVLRTNNCGINVFDYDGTKWRLLAWNYKGDV